MLPICVAPFNLLASKVDYVPGDPNLRLDCHQPKKEWVNMTQAEEEDPAHLMAVVEEVNITIESVPQQQVHLNDSKAQAFLGLSGNIDGCREGWYLDTEVMNHKTGQSDVSSELDRAV
jgi:hypothetical protein